MIFHWNFVVFFYFILSTISSKPRKHLFLCCIWDWESFCWFFYFFCVENARKRGVCSYVFKWKFRCVRMKINQKQNQKNDKKWKKKTHLWLLSFNRSDSIASKNIFILIISHNLCIFLLVDSFAHIWLKKCLFGLCDNRYLFGLFCLLCKSLYTREKYIFYFLFYL